MNLVGNVAFHPKRKRAEIGEFDALWQRADSYLFCAAGRG